MKQIATKTDTVDTLPANAFNSLSDENQNVVTKSGQTLDATSETTPDPSPTQVARAITKAALEARAYSDSGAANAYVLTAVGSWQQPTAYVNGLTVEFIGANANTGASTVNVAGLGVKNITTVTGAVINADSIGPDKISRIRFDSSGDRFLLEPVGGGSSGTGTGAFNYIANPDAETDATTGIGSQATTGSWTHTKSIVTSELAEPTSKLSVHKISGSGLTVGDYREFQAVGTINDAEGGRGGTGIAKVKDISGTISGQYKFQAYNKTTSQYIGESQTVLSGDRTYEFDVPLTAEEDIVIHLIALTPSPSSIGVSGVGIFFAPTKTSSISTAWNEETAAITDWDNTTGLTLNTGRLRWKRLEDTMIIKAHYRFSGSGTSGGEFLFNFGSILTNLTVGQDINQFDNSATGFSLNNLAGYPLGVDVRGPVKKVAFYTSGGTVRLGTNMDDSVSGELTYIGFTLILPITEWANSHSLTATEANYQNAKGAFTSNAGQAIANNTWTSMAFATPVTGNNIQGQWSGSVFTANRKGFLQVEGHNLWADAFTNAVSYRVLVDGATASKGKTYQPTSVAGGQGFGCKDLYLEAGQTVEFQTIHTEGVSRNRSTDALYNWIDINWTADRSGSSAGFPNTELISTVKQALVPITNESGEGDLGTITNWASPGTKKYRWVRLGIEVRFYWYVTSTGGSLSTSTSSLLFDLPAGIPTPTDHLSNDASGEFPAPCSGAASSNNFVKNELENNAGTYRIVASFSTNTAATSWSGMASWIILPTS